MDRLKATITRVLIGEKAFDVKTFGDDLSSLCEGKEVLGVEIDVDEWNVSPGPERKLDDLQWDGASWRA